MNFRAIENKLLQDNLSGSSEILNKTIQYNIFRLKHKNLNRSVVSHLIDFNKRLIIKFSSMSIVINGCRRLNKILRIHNTRKSNLPVLLKQIDNFLEEISLIDSKIIDNCAKLFNQKVTIATYSNSGLVKKVLAAYRTKIKRVILSEARPAGEGIVMAEYLSGIGIKVNLCADMLLPELIQAADYLLIGADRVGPNKFVNKIGTLLLLNTAKQLSIKRFVLCESLKFSQTDPRPHKNDRHPPNEIAGKLINRNINLINRYFEIIPNRMIDRFITDLSAFSPAALYRIIKKH